MKFKLSESGAFRGNFEFGELSVSGNSEIGFRPFQLLVSSIVGCSGSVFRTVLDKKRISYDTIDIEASVERDEQKANKVTKIELHFIIEGKNLNLDQLQKSLHVSMKNCAMVQSVIDAITIEETIEIRESAVTFE
ncbi:OsmC family protein [Niallia oryzisoli]|uniref:OsmC family protein n=1 Tax=Niallia oryzisoli TaxID=1737571 RepID=A0ABZ2CP84_9BACI